MFKNTLVWTIITAIFTGIVYIDILYFIGAFYITMPLAILAAIISIIVSLKEKKAIFILINVILAIVALAPFVIFP